MDIEFSVRQDLTGFAECDVLVLGVLHGGPTESDIVWADKALQKEIQDLLITPEFPAEFGETHWVHLPHSVFAKRILLVGLGKASAINTDRIRQAAAVISRSAARLDSAFLPVVGAWRRAGQIQDVAQAIAEGALLGPDGPGRDKEPPHLERLVLWIDRVTDISAVEQGVEIGQRIAEGVILARRIADAPAGVMTPKALSQTAKQLAADVELGCTSIEGDELEQGGFAGLKAVGLGSMNAPVFVAVEYCQPRSPGGTIVLVGKGVTFDSGGLSLKARDKIEKMKYDKAGAAAVLGIMQAIGRLQLPIHVVGLIPAAENMPSGTAFKPGDVIRMASGKSVEIKSTDAEGRLILADALTYARRYNPDVVIDLATLTGACAIALANVASGLFSNSLELLDQLRKAGDRTGERVWTLPLYPEYREQLKSRMADLRTNAGREGGACIAAAFLEEFVDYNWAHVDIAGTAWDNSLKKYNPKEGATGVGVRLIIQFLRDWVVRR
jgi:leucyl aminopeptidase